MIERISFTEFLSIKECSDNVFSFMVQSQHLNDHGMVHAGVLYSLCAETVAVYVEKKEKREGIGAEGSIHYYRAAKLNDTLSITVVPRKSGKRMSIYLIEIKNSEDKLIADAMFTVAHPAANEIIGKQQ